MLVYHITVVGVVISQDIRMFSDLALTLSECIFLYLFLLLLRRRLLDAELKVLCRTCFFHYVTSPSAAALLFINHVTINTDS